TAAGQSRIPTGFPLATPRPETGEPPAATQDSGAVRQDKDVRPVGAAGSDVPCHSRQCTATSELALINHRTGQQLGTFPGPRDVQVLTSARTRHVDQSSLPGPCDLTFRLLKLPNAPWRELTLRDTHNRDS